MKIRNRRSELLIRTGLCHVILCFGFIQLSMVSPSNAEGRMYVPKAEPSVKYQLCRLKKVERTDSSTSCFYKAQKVGDDVVVSTETSRTVCQREFSCKIQ